MLKTHSVENWLIDLKMVRKKISEKNVCYFLTGRYVLKTSSFADVVIQLSEGGQHRAALPADTSGEGRQHRAALPADTGSEVADILADLVEPACLQARWVFISENCPIRQICVVVLA